MVDTESIAVKESVREKIKLDKAYLNYHNIIDKNLPYKFSYLDEWMLKKSKLLLTESENLSNEDDEIEKNNKYRVYDRGTIIKVDFGVNLGSEMSQVHFAIVLNNYDNPKNNVLTVVPLTSKNSKFNLNLGALVIKKLTNKIQKEINNLSNNLTNEENNILETKIKIKKLHTLCSYYKSNEKNTYACCSLITTISKSRIFKPINEYDIIGRTKCSASVMEKIDLEIKDRILYRNELTK